MTMSNEERKRELESIDRAALEILKRAARGEGEVRTVTTTTVTGADGNVTTTTKESVKALPPDEDAARWLRERGIEF